MINPQAHTLTPVQIQSAFNTSLKMLQDENVSTPNSWNKDLVNLEQIVIAILSGQLQLSPAPAKPEIIDDKDGDGDGNE